SQPQVLVESPYHPFSKQKANYPAFKDPQNDAPELVPNRSNRICGLRRQTFWIISGIAAITVIAAAVGGGVGGSVSAHKKQSSAATAASDSGTVRTTSTISGLATATASPTATGTAKPGYCSKSVPNWISQ